MKKRRKLSGNEPSIMFFDLGKDVNTSPIISERIAKQKPYVFFGKDNLFPQDLIALSDNSTLHSALLETSSKWIAGDGLVIEADSDRERKKAQDVLNDLFEDERYLWKIAKDVALFGGYYLNVLWNNGGQIEQLKHVDFSTIRVSKMDVQTKEIPSYWFSSDWKVATHKRQYTGQDVIYEPEEIAAFDPKTIRDHLSREHGQLLQIKDYKPGKLFYAEPMYLGALSYIDISGKVGDLHQANLKNGFVPNYHMHLFEDLSDPEKRRRVEQGINEKFAGSHNAGKIVVTYSSDADIRPMLEPLQANNVHEMYTLLNEKVNAEIIMAHRIPPYLANININNGFSDNGNAMRVSTELYQNTVVLPYQRMITNVLDKLLRINGVEVKTTIAGLNPMSLLGDVELIKETVFKNEYRVTLGLEEDESLDGMLISETPM